MKLYRSATDYNYHNSDQGQTVGQEPVGLELDGWVESQLEAGLIIEVGEVKPAKSTKKDPAES